ncbi:MAG: STAS domain-containing protein [Planctomycetota bacterium]
MKKCPFCGSLVPDVAHYCAKCGESFSDEEAMEPRGVAQQPPEARTSLKIELQKIAGPPSVTVIILHGEIDNPGAMVLQNTLRRCTISTAPRVVLDFGQVTTVCSSGYSTLLSWVRDRESDAPGTVAIVSVREEVMRQLVSMGIADCLPIFNDKRKALRLLLGAE